MTGLYEDILKISINRSVLFKVRNILSYDYLKYVFAIISNLSCDYLKFLVAIRPIFLASDD